ncbi:hypothetical protein ABW20_dc0108087 [Dactylellina cionopaga]|nr:hypothetical protein ABW20_dc0108087 [Dactylellina cionopaga]
MRICVFHSSYEGSDSPLREVNTVPSNLSALTTQHTFKNLFIHKATAREEIDAAISEGFDFYLNFMWGTFEDPVAGVEESRYFESLGLPSAGFRSWERTLTKNDFYESARRYGAPPVPGNKHFPLIVKPANGCINQTTHESSVCHDEKELQTALRRINGELYEARVRRAKALGIEDTKAYVDSYDPTGRYSDDIVTQEYIDGQDYTVTVIEMSDACVALPPIIHKMEQMSIKEQPSKFDLKGDQETCLHLVENESNIYLFERLQQVALEAFQASGCKGNNMGCDVVVRVRRDGEVFAIDVNPKAAAFITEKLLQGLPNLHSLPGGYPAAINIFIANQIIRDPGQSVFSKVAGTYNRIASKYDMEIKTNTTMHNGMRKVVDEFNFSGTVFDIACGTGIFGRILAESADAGRDKEVSCLFGSDISSGMIDICRETGLYDQLHIERMQTCLINHHNDGDIDHIVCFSAVHFLSVSEFAFVLVLCFVLAKKSITLTVDEIPDVYNKHLAERGEPFMHSTNHLANMEAFGEPLGWRLKSRHKQFSWTSGATGDKVFTNYFRFERTNESNRELVFRKFDALH